MSAENDIVTRLRSSALILFCNGADGGAFLYEHAADEIELLRQVGDKLAMHLDAFFGMLEPASNEITDVLKEWKEARRG